MHVYNVITRPFLLGRRQFLQCVFFSRRGKTYVSPARQRELFDGKEFLVCRTESPPRRESAPPPPVISAVAAGGRRCKR